MVEEATVIPLHKTEGCKIARIFIEILDAEELELSEPIQLIWDATLEICPEKIRAAHERQEPQAASTSQSSQGAMPPDVGEDKSGASQGVWAQRKKNRHKDP